MTDHEHNFLEAVLKDSSILTMSRLTGEMFSPEYQPIFEAMVDLASKGKVNRRAMAQILPASVHELLFTVNPSYTTATWEFNHGKILESWIAKVLHHASKVAMTQTGPEALDTLDKAVRTAAAADSPGKTVRLDTLLLPTMEKFISGEMNQGIPWGFGTIDKMSLGARPGQLVVIGARPSQGKSALMAQLVLNQSRHVKLGVITIESDATELTTRLMANASMTDSRKLVDGSFRNSGTGRFSHDINAMVETAKNVQIHDRPGITLRQVQSEARRMAADGAKVIYIDYLQLVKVPGKKDKREEVAEISNALKQIARELKVCVVSLAQLSRDADEKRPHMGEMQHSSQIEQDADQVWLIYHQRVKDDEGREKFESALILDKVRDGATGAVRMHFQRDQSAWHEVANA